MNKVYIDVRTPAEYAAGHYPGAINHPVELISEGVYPHIDKDAAIILYCRSGGRAGMAQQYMAQAGFSNVSNGGGLSDVMGS